MNSNHKAAAAWDDYVSRQRKEKIGELERELNAANAHIKRLEEAGDEAIHNAAYGREDDALEIWNKAKEAKP